MVILTETVIRQKLFQNSATEMLAEWAVYSKLLLENYFTKY